MADKVYVFNLYSEEVSSLSTNEGASAGTIAAPDPGATAPYTPSQLVVPRSWEEKSQLNPGDPSVFVVGENDIAVGYGHQTWTGQVTIPAAPEVPKDQDLWLYLVFPDAAGGSAYLFTTNGELLPNAAGDKAPSPMKKMD